MEIVHKRLKPEMAETITIQPNGGMKPGTTRSNTNPNSVNACNDVMIKIR
jgi:hypothetical protein